jgi:hypothetical protein
VNSLLVEVAVGFRLLEASFTSAKPFGYSPAVLAVSSAALPNCQEKTGLCTRSS